MIQPPKEAHGGQLDPKLVDPDATLNEKNYKEFVKEVLDTHNKYRKIHGVPPLEMKKEISEYSKNWANSLAKMKRMAHSKIEDRPTYGENVYYANLKYVPGSLPVHSWYSEAKEENYKYGMEPPNLRAGHFTQVVWKSSKYLGVGAVSWDKGIFIVCNYEPRGNIIGKFTENVLSPK